MRNSFKKGISKWFLLFLFTFFSMGMQGQYSENTEVNDMIADAWEETEAGTNSSWDVDDNGDLNETDFDEDKNDSDNYDYSVTMTDDEYRDHLHIFGGSCLCEAGHTQSNMDNPNSDAHTDAHIVKGVFYNQDDREWDSFMQEYNEWASRMEQEEENSLIDYYNSLENELNSDNENNTGDSSSSDDSPSPSTDDPKPDDCLVAKCPKFYRVKAGTCDCVKVKLWYIDKDIDGWYSNVKSARKSPGTGWIDNDLTPLKGGYDCDDTKPSVDNICAPIDICAEIKKQQADTEYQTIMADLQDKKTLALHHETGYWQDSKDNFNAMLVDKGDDASVNFPKDISTMQNCNHVHTDDWKDDVTAEIHSSIPMPSRKDIWQVYNTYINSRENGLDLGNTYIGNVSSMGSFQMRFIGNSKDITPLQVDNDYSKIVTEANLTAYQTAVNKNGNIAGFLIFLRDTLKITDIALYQIEATGVSKLELDASNQVIKTPC